MSALVILIAISVVFIATTGFLLWAGRFGRRGLIWTMRMGDDS